MKFTDKDLLKAMGLEVGDSFKTRCDIYKIIESGCGIIIVSTKNCATLYLKDFINTNFEKVEQKIWTRETYELGEDEAFFVDYNGEVAWRRVHTRYNSKILDDYIYFTKRKYAEEYLKELKKFNEEYKKNN